MVLAGSRAGYFVGDFLAVTASSSLVAAMVGIALPASWPLWVSMPVGMLAGMALSVACWLTISPLLGVVEPMLVTMLGGMLAGMAAGMAASQHPSAGLAALAELGAKCGVGAFCFTAGMDWLLRRTTGDG